jgi:hypothetical protein
LAQESPSRLGRMLESWRQALTAYLLVMNERPSNRRRFLRRTVNEPAWLERVPAILERCTLLDLSKSGARLSISDIYDLPESFTLRLIRESAEPQVCHVIWRRDHVIGVEFVSPAPGKVRVPVVYNRLRGREGGAVLMSIVRTAFANFVTSLVPRPVDSRLAARTTTMLLRSHRLPRATRIVI